MKKKASIYHRGPGIWLLCACALGTLDASGAYPKGYYYSLDGKCGVELMHAVKDVVRKHRVISYGDKTWEAFKVTDVKVIDGQEYWWDMYSTNLVMTASGHSGLNIEHSVANSWWGKTKNDAYKDIVHLNPSDADANNRKSNFPLSDLSEITWTNGITNIGKPVDGQGGGSSKAYMPCDEYKGDFARAFMYVFTVYDDISWASKTEWMYNVSGNALMFQDWAQALLIDWSANDPVSDKERMRNDGIYQVQENRNPFIDLPDLADHIWGDKKTEPYHVEGAEPPLEGETFEWLSASSATLSDGWRFENVLVPDGTSHIWSWSNSGDNHFLKASAYIGGKAHASESYAWSPAVDMTDVSKAELTFDHAARYQTNCREVCKVAVKETDDDKVTLLDIPQWPAAGNWTFRNSGTIDLSQFSGKTIRIGFHYVSTDQEADTWEVNNVSLTLAHEESGVEHGPQFNEDEDDSFLVEVWGNNILVPEGALIYDLNGRQYSGTGLSRGVYIVTKPSFKKAIKILIK